jgi:hypothetical protein
MKKHLSKNSFWLSLLSAVTSGIFILLALGSLEGIAPVTQLTLLENGLYEEKTGLLSGDVLMSNKVVTGKRDLQGRWYGKVTTNWYGQGEYTEEAYMLNGKREGPCTRTYRDGRKVEEYYVNDVLFHKSTKMAHDLKTAVSAFQVLEDKYPWYLFSLNACGFDDDMVKAFLDTVETALNGYDFEISEFDTYYEDVLDDAGGTRFDSIIGLNSNLFLTEGLKEMKNSELRLAVIEHCKPQGNPTYNIITTIYPGYLAALNDSGVISQDFEKFCQDLDDSLAGFDPLDPEDPFYTDSIDNRLFVTLSSFIDLKKSSSLAGLSLKTKTHNLLRQLSLQMGSSEVASVLLSGMLRQFLQGDIVRKAEREAWCIQKGITRLPTLGISFSENISATSVSLHGYVVDDGGSTLTSRGIAWATFFNPTVSDNVATPETETGDFSVMLTGLTEGSTYYARTYAANSAGTAYGNCIGFIATSPTVVRDHKTFEKNFTVFPNPASGNTTFSFKLESAQGMVLTILDIKGRMLYSKDLGKLPAGDNRIKINLNSFQNGIYTCRLTNGTLKATRNFVIAR